VANEVERYLESKGIDYHLDGENAIFNCPFCGETEGKFGINITNWQGHCFKSKCDIGVNEITFKRKYGDSVHTVSNFEDSVAQVPTVAKKTNKPEVPQDPEIAHKALLEDTEIMNWLNDSVGFSMATIKAAKLGLGKRKFAPHHLSAQEKKDWHISPALTFPYFRKGKCYGVKFKTLPPEEKDFRFTSGVDLGLYREDVIKPGMESLLMVEGEKDALTLVTHGYDNVVGVPGAKVKNAFWAEMLDLPKKLYLIMDNDQVGIDGAKAFATRFGADRIHIVNIPHLPMDEPVVDKHGTRTTTSDVTDFFQAGGTKEQFDALLAEAKVEDIEGVTTMDSAFDKMIARIDSGDTTEFPYLFKWASVNTRAKGCKKGDLITVLAAPKCGKTSFLLNQCEYMVETYGHRIHFSCFEMDDDELNRKWLAMQLGVDIETLTREQIVEGKRTNKQRGNPFVYTRPHPTSLDNYVELLAKTKRRYATDVLVVDNFQYLVDLTIGKGSGDSRPNYMSKVSKTLKVIAKELDMVTFLVSQPRNIEEGAMVTVNHSEGSGTLKADSDLFFTFNRAPEVKMKLEQLQAIGNLETNQSHSDNMYVEVGLSRRSKGGFCTLKIDGATSTIREFHEAERNANTRKTLIAGIEIIDENEVTTI
jgi:KaiC/GvpD/RAD55 family RecA-like ATPase